MPFRRTAAVCLLFCIFLRGCLLRPASPDDAQAEALVPADSTASEQSPVPVPSSPEPALPPVPEPTPVPSPTPVPEPTPSPVPTPMIQEEWYAERTEEMRRFMQLYGEYSSEEEIDAVIQRMEIDPDRPMIALTFDDGPMAGITDEIVDILAQYDARATFFIIGSRFAYDATPGLLRKILGHGNAIGNHMYNHDRMDKTDYKTLLRSASRLNEKIFETTGYTCHLLRPPGGYDAHTASKLGKRFDMSVILWAQSGNVHERDPEKINENVHRQIVNGKKLEDGDIVLLHDTKPWMVDAVRIMVPQLIEEGYQLVTVPELLHLSDRGFVYGEVYKKKN